MSEAQTVQSYRTVTHAAAADALRRAMDEAFDQGMTVTFVGINIEASPGEPTFPVPDIIETRTTP